MAKKPAMINKPAKPLRLAFHPGQMNWFRKSTVLFLPCKCKNMRFKGFDFIFEFINGGAFRRGGCTFKIAPDMSSLVNENNSGAVNKLIAWFGLFR